MLRSTVLVCLCGIFIWYASDRQTGPRTADSLNATYDYIVGKYGSM